jgi:hypothetical protein
MAATATKAPADLLAERKLVRQKCDELIEAAITEGRPLNYDDLDFLNNVGGFDRPKINERMRAIGNRIRLQQIAGDTATRAGLKQHADAAQAEFDTRGPELLEQIAKLEAEHNKLEKQATTLNRRFDETQHALEQLLRYADEDVQARVLPRLMQSSKVWAVI